jgi:peptide/nickel transport system substrate-binding protein
MIQNIKIIYNYLSLLKMYQSKKKIIKIISIIILLFLSTIYTGCIDNSKNTEPYENKDTLIYATFDNKSIYPYYPTTNNLNVLMVNIFNGLVEFDEFYQITPSLAKSWNNINDTTWRFYLKENVKFHNNHNFTSQDVNYSFSQYPSYKSFIKKTMIIDNYTIDVLTHEPFPSFLQRIAFNFLIFPSNYDNFINDNPPVGTGPYKFAEYDENNYTKLEIFENYWKEKPKIKNIIFKYIENKNERINNLKDGNLDIIEYNVDNDIDDIIQYENIIIQKYPPLSTYIIGFDLRENNSYGFPDGKNPTSDIRVRKAIYHSIDINPLINGPFQGFAIPATQFLTTYIFGYNPSIKRLEYNLSIAKELLYEAGYEDGFNIEMDCITIGYDYNDENCELIKDQLSEVGIDLKLNKMSSEEFYQKVLFERNTSLWLVGWGTISFDGGWVYDQFITTNDEEQGFYNSGYYSNMEVDILGKQASSEMNPIIRQNLLQEGFKIALVDDIIVIPLFSQELFVITQDNVVMEINPDMKLKMENIYFK